MTYGPGQYQRPYGQDGSGGYPSQQAGWAGPPMGMAHAAPLPHLPTVPRKGQRATFWVFLALILPLIGVSAYFLSALGADAALPGMFLAFIPLGIVFLAALLVDRWDPEPPSLILFAVLWGAIIAVGFALLVDWSLQGIFINTPTRMFLRAVVQAPVVEEVAKGIGLLVLFWIGRRTFDGPVDGVVYAMLIAAGFAFTENIQYFGIQLAQGESGHVGQVFVLRGLMSPFAHAMFTCVTGMAVGYAARHGRNSSVFGWFLLGLFGAVGLHALWNGLPNLLPSDDAFYVLYAALWIPMFIVFITLVVLLRRSEARITRLRLGEYAQAGWFTPQEVTMLATGQGRRAARAWAAMLPGNRSRVMRDFIHDATALASTRQRALGGRDPYAAQEEWVLLQRTTMQRQALLSR